MGAPKGHPPYNTKGEGGRPLIYDEAFIENEAIALEDWINDEENESIFITEFASQRRYSRQRFVEFAEKSKRFADALELSKEWQEHKLAKGALTRLYDAGFTKFVMPRMCGDHWQEVKNIKVTTNGPVTDLIGEIDGDSKDLINDKKTRKS